MEKIDLVGLGEAIKEGKEPIMKFLDMIEKFCGRLTRAFFDRKDIDNEVYKATKLVELDAYKQELSIGLKAKEINIISNAIIENPQQNISYEDGKSKIASLEKDKLLIERKSGETTINLTTNNIENRFVDRLLKQGERKQQNVENILQITYDEVISQPKGSNEDVDDDWLNRFFNYAEDVSDDKMQIIWGKILAGEIKQPNSYSLRLLEILKNITKQEADIFVKISKFVTSNNHKGFIFCLKYDDFKNIGITFEELLLLEEIGLISTNPIKFASIPEKIVFMYHNIALKSIIREGITVYPLSSIAMQLLKLNKITANFEYLKLINTEFFSLKLEYAEIVNNFSNGEIECGDWKNISDLE